MQSNPLYVGNCGFFSSIHSVSGRTTYLQQQQSDTILLLNEFKLAATQNRGKILLCLWSLEKNAQPFHKHKHKSFAFTHVDRYTNVYFL